LGGYDQRSDRQGQASRHRPPKLLTEGRLPRGIGIERLRDLTAEWSQQFEILGLNPE
jgi:hypothetical protein